MIHVEKIRFSVGNFALDDVSLEVAPGEYFVLLGPSGSGKTLLLECLCGLNRIDSGRVVIGDVDVTRLEPRRRGIGYLPQDYALFPHLTVRRNVAFGLKGRSAHSTADRGEPNRRARKRSTEEIDSQVDEVMGLVGVAFLADRRPERLSGGEKQRVALARALAVRPRVLLLDEPVSALDEQTRDGLCTELKRLQRSTRTTTVHVCHNFAEMMAVADRVGIIHDGRIVQVGTPREILERPRNRFVAQFVQAGNVFSARAEPDGPWLRLTRDRIEFRAPRSSSHAEGDVLFMIRPENVHVRTVPFDGLPPGAATLEGTVSRLADAGALIRLAVDCGAEEARTQFSISLGRKEYSACRVEVGDRVCLAVFPDDVHVLES
ncbi:MAG: ABC transporter ATP-binding protein [Planctomycetota bacterium]|jgi:ABC-type Fe3+/spermidine/putrescine transport system ATPase subunit